MAFLTTLAGDPSEAQDLVQETFVRAWRAAPRWEPRGRASTWLFTIARHAASNWRASRGVRRQAEAHALPRSAPGAESPSDLPAALAAAVQGLSEPLRVVFVLARLHGCTLAETAEIAAIPEGTVKSRLAAAEAALRATLAPHLRKDGGDR
jgi:RNA polymerase sigma-70 factor (ECF subfamily)